MSEHSKSYSGVLPMTRAEMDRLGWRELDVLLVSGDAYVDHPSFGVAVLGRWLATHGYRMGIVAQPRWDRPDDIVAMGRPRLFAGVTAGALDSMLAHYTAFRKKRSDDAYTPGGAAGRRPNRAALVYAGLVKQAMPGLPIVLGGIEASLRRITHYDFWTDKLRRAILLDAKADLLLYGMAERSILAAAAAFETLAGDVDRAARSRAFAAIGGAAFIGNESDIPEGAAVIRLPSHEEMLADPAALMEATLSQERQVHQGAWAVQSVEGRSLILTPPSPVTGEELDAIYAMPFTREPHPSYREAVPAADMIRFSITSHRGCAGGCSFCGLAAHQGRRIASRSAGSIEAEAQAMTRHAQWRGSISDVGGPTANMWGARCSGDASTCTRASCLTPAICRNFVDAQGANAALLEKVRTTSGVKNVRVASGVRYDLAMRSSAYLETLIGQFVGGQLKIAPEHIADRVLRLMRKPPAEAFEKFLELFERLCQRAGKEQFVVPYLISAFPGCTEADMRQLAAWLKQRGWKPQQVQCFIPLPGTVAAAMFYAGIDPQGHAIPVARTDAERLRMHYLLAPAGEDSPRRTQRSQSKKREGVKFEGRRGSSRFGNRRTK
ncbi:MAG: YgiQ family radical SAM protein [Planctomycetaceae bacterium]|nr:YgiQ family radical SAM protein [Planctomycetaceae bacterium]